MLYYFLGYMLVDLVGVPLAAYNSYKLWNKNDSIENKIWVEESNSKEQKIVASVSTITTERDSIALTTLVREAYTWSYDNVTDEFPYLVKNESDSIFTGIDWKAYKATMLAYKNTDYFTEEFFKYHEIVATNIDASIRSADIKWRNMNDGISLWSSEVDDWCNCQDYPEDYWKTLVINQLMIKDTIAHFNLNWENYGEYSSMNYAVTAKKVDGKWKINALEGYQNYYTKEEYASFMSEE
ncbi:hypothetical protein SAMN05216480_10436 [Pustulibacterium marinum]|uniref:DUF3828 domain-containing protein n=2 Tax=Pustulibacterium marinum TaxID=1224947 RepID=A0A1I7GAT5_9FLAO|nr:hypothetical protein SAMN05216480_10436 [Pustulibacterium marinum]